jgi:hypothetical protein
MAPGERCLAMPYVDAVDLDRTAGTPRRGIIADGSPGPVARLGTAGQVGFADARQASTGTP